MAKDFEVRKTTRRMMDNKIEHVTGEVVDNQKNNSSISGKDQLLGAVADNFDRIVDIASSIVEIERLNAEADAHIRELEEQRKMLSEEADAYVKVLNAKTHNTVSKAEVVRQMMKDYYIHGKDGLSGEEFSKIITDVIAKIGDINE